MKKRGSLIPGIILVAVGVLMLLDILGIYFFQWDQVLPVFAVLLGVNLWIRAVRFKPRRGVFPGTLLVVLGVFFFLYRYGEIERYFYYEGFVPIIPTALGLAFFSLFLFDYHKWWAIFPAIPLLLMGACSFLFTLGILDIYNIEDTIYNVEDILFDVRNYFPLVLVFIGIIFIVSSIRKARRPKYED